MLPFKTVLALVVLATSAHTAIADEICVEGYLMDIFCINDGFLFQDKADVPTQLTLSSADVHMAKCLVGMPFCRESGYEVLLDPLVTTNDWCRGYNFDAAGNEKIIAYAKAQGNWTMETNPDGTPCGDFCTGDGDVVAGMRASIRGSILAGSTNSTTAPPTLVVTSVMTAGNCTASEIAMGHALTDFNGNCTTGLATPPSGTSTTAVGFGMIVMMVIVQSLLQF